MFFSGGLIPTFLWMRDLGLYNSPWIMILMGMVSVWNLMVARTYIQTSIPNELYEAASIDGAGKWRQFFSITVPLITPVIFYNLVTQLCQAFQEFNGPYIIFNNGGPRGSVTLVSLLVYNYAFKSNEMGMACAMAWVMFIIIALLTVIAFGSQKHWVYYAD